MKRVNFFAEGVKNLKTVGTITRSSRILCRNMVKQIDFKEAKTIVELGAGDGVITRFILENMEADAKLLVFEINESFSKFLYKINDPRMIIIEDSAEKLGQYLEEHKIEKIDYVLSALPFTVFPKPLATSIISSCREYMKQGGLFIQLHYSLLPKKLYQTIFGNVKVNFVPWNVPPAFVLVSEK